MVGSHVSWGCGGSHTCQWAMVNAKAGRKGVKKAQPGFTPDLRPSSAWKEWYCEDGDLEYDERCCTGPNSGVCVACHAGTGEPR